MLETFKDQKTVPAPDLHHEKVNTGINDEKLKLNSSVRDIVLKDLIAPANTKNFVSGAYIAAEHGIKDFWPLVFPGRAIGGAENDYILDIPDPQLPHTISTNGDNSEYSQSLKTCFEFRTALGYNNPTIINSQEKLSHYTSLERLKGNSVRYVSIIPTGGTIDEIAIKNTKNELPNDFRPDLFREKVFDAHERRGLLVETVNEILLENSVLKNEFYRVLRALGNDPIFIDRVDEVARKACGKMEIAEIDSTNFLNQLNRMASEILSTDNAVDPDVPILFVKAGKTASGFGLVKFSLNQLNNISNGSKLLEYISEEMSDSESRPGQNVTPKTVQTVFLDNSERRFIIQKAYNGLNGREISMTTSQIKIKQLKEIRKNNGHYKLPGVGLFTTINLTNKDAVHIGNVINLGNNFDNAFIDSAILDQDEVVAMQMLFGYIGDRISGVVDSAADYFSREQTPVSGIDYRFDENGNPVVLDVNRGRYNANMYTMTDFYNRFLVKGETNSDLISHRNFDLHGVSKEMFYKPGFATELGTNLVKNGIKNFGTVLGACYLEVEGGCCVSGYVHHSDPTELTKNQEQFEAILKNSVKETVSKFT